MTVTGIDELKDRLASKAAAAMDATANNVTDEQRALINSNSGKLAASVGWTAEDDALLLRRRFVASEDYALYQDKGTGIYGPRGAPIRASEVTANGRYMVFEIGGQLIFAKQVKGTPATGFFSTPLERAIERLHGNYAQAAA